MTNKSKLVNKIKEGAITVLCASAILGSSYLIVEKIAEPPVYCVDGFTVKVHYAPFDFPTLEVIKPNGEVQREYDLGAFASHNIQNYPSGECKKTDLSDKINE